RQIGARLFEARAGRGPRFGALEPRAERSARRLRLLEREQRGGAPLAELGHGALRRERVLPPMSELRQLLLELLHALAGFGEARALPALALARRREAAIDLRLRCVERALEHRILRQRRERAREPEAPGAVAVVR